jgi:hypothetical protein
MEPSHASTALVQFLAADLRLPQRRGQHAGRMEPVEAERPMRWKDMAHIHHVLSILQAPSAASRLRLEGRPSRIECPLGSGLGRNTRHWRRFLCQ